MKFTILQLTALCISLHVFSKEILLSKGLIITSSVTVRKNTYRINGSDSLNQPVILISGDNITVDFNNAELVGSNDKDWPNQFYGCAILIKGGKNITIKNANIHGFKIGIWGQKLLNLVIENTDLSYNYRQKLQSNRLREDVSDWMSYHHNEYNEWQRYGAAIYLTDCTASDIHDNKITGGQCALMMTNCNKGMISNNNFSFNSGIGIGLYRSSANMIINNNLDFNVRGYSHGIFNRGQDSADILVFEQSNDNTFSNNSATHGGDGFFLWAGQSTMDNGQGGCNNNIVFHNDFSYAPTNGVEITFSKNRIIDNTITECDNGIWGGYSFNSILAGNKIEKNTVGIAIEHGQEDIIQSNSFSQNKTAVKLWAKNDQSNDWGYVHKRDTKSRDYQIMANTFNGDETGLNIALTTNIRLWGNSFQNVLKQYKIDEKTTGLDSVSSYPSPPLQMPSLPGGMKEKEHYPPGKKEIRITRWGPYDFGYPILWLTKIDSSGKLFFDLLGPKGSWVINKFKGVTNISSNAGTFPTSITAVKTSDDVSIDAEYTGEAFTTQFGEKISKGKTYHFIYRYFTPQISWDVKWYAWDKAHDPNKDYKAFTKILGGDPIKQEKADKLDYTWWGEIGPHLPADSFATVATARMRVPAGKYDLGVTADDLVKVIIDGRTLIDFWDASKYVNDEDAHHSITWQSDGGEHTIRIEHVENAGYATLIFTLNPL